MATGNIAVRIAKWPFEQVKGWTENAWAVLTKYSAEDFVPPAVADTWSWLKDQVPQAFGWGTPGEQISSSIVLIFASIATSLFSGGITLFFVGVFLLTLAGGLLRLWPVIDDLWPFGTSET